MKTPALQPRSVLPYGASVALRAAGALLTVWAAASAQSLVEPEQVAAIRNAFDSAATAPQLRCEIKAIRPALNFSLRFQTGYVVDVPLVQFRGPGHGLSVFIRLTPEGLRPTYLASTANLLDVPASDVSATRAYGEVAGMFVVGEGNYDVEAVVEDDLHRACHSKWRIQATRTGSERELKPTTPPATVEEISVSGPGLPESKGTLPESNQPQESGGLRS